MSEAEILAAKRMRILRLGAGMTAESLARACAREGAAALDRGTIAKIESNTRKIKAGEVDVVARVFGLTSADLLDLAGPVVFLSYAGQDGDAGHEVSRWLADRGFRVLSADPVGPASQMAGELPDVIDGTQAFVALLSPAFLASGECLAELDLAIRRGQRVHPASYIHVVHVGDTADLDTSSLHGYQPIDLRSAGGRKKEEALSKLGSGILRGGGAEARGGPTGPASDWAAFLDRRDELDYVLNGLNNPVGSHFWLITSPPGLGKSRFLAELATRAEQLAERPWLPRLLDPNDRAGEFAADAMVLIGELFGVALSGVVDVDLRTAAREIIKAGRPYLCLLDNCEVLPRETVTALRRYLGQIHGLIQERGDSSLGLALVAASRRDDGWRGVEPRPRLSILPLAEFGTDSVQEAVTRLASDMNLQRSPAGLRHNAEIVHETTEGVPALVRLCLRWIRDEEGLQIERLNQAAVFDDLVGPFVKDELLAADSLLPGDTSPAEISEKRIAIVEQAIKWLVLYRSFTQAHLRSLSSDESLTVVMNEADWSDNDLWQAMDACALLTRPLDEPWQEIHPALRRLLFRYFYPEAERSNAHDRARKFTEQWADKQNGREHVIGLIDCIWHEAARLKLTNAEEMGGVLTNYALERAQTIGASDAYTENELRVFAADRVRTDDELRGEVAGIDGLFDSLIQVFEGTSPDRGVT